MGGGSVKPRTTSSRLHNHKESKYAPPSTHYYSPSRQRSPSPPRWRIVTQAEINAELARRAKAVLNYRREMEEAAAAEERARLAAEARKEKARIEAEAKKIANKIKQNNRLAALAAAKVNNTNLAKIFKNNKTILSRLRHLAARLRK